MRGGLRVNEIRVIEFNHSAQQQLNQSADEPGNGAVGVVFLAIERLRNGVDCVL